MDYKKVERALSVIIGDNKQILTVFETAFRDTISSLDMQILASGTIPAKIVSNCMAAALQRAAEEAKTSGLNSLAAQLWNPLTACLVQQVSCQPTSVPNTKQKPSEKSSTIVKPVVKEKLVSKADPVDYTAAKKIRAKLKQHLPTTGYFNNSYHSHISCITPNCQFCCDLYHQVNITKCSGHKQCHPVGYYPHVGKTLWKLLKGKHEKREPCKLQNKPCSSGQITNLAFETQEVESDTDFGMEINSNSASSWAEQCELEKEAVIYPSPRKVKRRCSTSLC